ncbi:MAG TPA: G5 domain-containing protein [Anaerolineales bacterium]|nr:G5 domain-containing protein [Anaerolineales bacterium]
MHSIFLRRPPHLRTTPPASGASMRQVKASIKLTASLLVSMIALSLLTSCRSPQVPSADITINITADGESHDVTVPAGSTVGQALQSAGIKIESLDRAEPPLYTVMNNGDAIILTRVKEVFETEEQVIPFERQVVRNESLPEGETRLVQAGANGLQELTYRQVLEDDVEISRSVVKSVILQEAVPEIVMIGAQASFAPLPIPGKLVYLAGGNAWIIDTSTANRTPLVTTGDLDGRIFELAPNGSYLIYTRKSTKPADKEINTLWAVRAIAGSKPFSTGISNVVHFADWIPNTGSIAYSTVEPRSTAPGWQANNDLHRYSISTGEKRKILDASSGGVYGWWGMTFAFSADGRLAYARPDGIGLVDLDGKYLKPLLDITPLNTHSDWAWLPAVSWGADGKTLYYTSHAPPTNLVSEEDSPFFDISATSFENNATIQIAQQTGMFAYPSASALQSSPRERQYQVAFLQATFPEQSETSRYRVVVMDRDGSNRRTIFPTNDAPGLEPQTLAWAPDPIDGQAGDFLAVIYQGNLWLIDSGNNQAYQVTGDGLVTRIDWR